MMLVTVSTLISICQVKYQTATRDFLWLLARRGGAKKPQGRSAPVAVQSEQS
jgi:hypothetical protein